MPCYRLFMGNVDDVRKALEEVVAPSLTELKTKVGIIQTELPAMEARLMKTIEVAKNRSLIDCACLGSIYPER